MKNIFELLKNGLVIIYCFDVQTNERVEVFLDKITFNYILKFNVEWKIYRGDNYFSKEVKAIFPEGGLTKLRVVIGKAFFNPELRFSLINGDYTDLRLCNFYPYPQNGSRGGSLKKIKKQLLVSQESLMNRLKKENVSNDIVIVNYCDGLLLIENNYNNYTKVNNLQIKAIIDSQTSIIER